MHFLQVIKINHFLSQKLTYDTFGPNYLGIFVGSRNFGIFTLSGTLEYQCYDSKLNPQYQYYQSYQASESTQASSGSVVGSPLQRAVAILTIFWRLPLPPPVLSPTSNSHFHLAPLYFPLQIKGNFKRHGQDFPNKMRIFLNVFCQIDPQKCNLNTDLGYFFQFYREGWMGFQRLFLKSILLPWQASPTFLSLWIIE